MRLTLITAALSAALLTGACTGGPRHQATPYQPDTGGAGGYSERQVADTRYRVAFAGNTRTSREDVERGLLYRAAEITLREGGDWFQVISRDTETDRRTEVIQHGYVPGPSLFPHRRYGRHGYRHRGFGPGFGPGFGRRGFYGHGFFGGGFYDTEERVLERYDASAEIIVHSGERDLNIRRAYDARAILAVIGPKLRRPAES